MAETSKSGSHDENNAHSDEHNNKAQDRGLTLNHLLPISIIVRIMKKVLPHHVRVTEDGEQIVRVCALLFMTFVTMQANIKRQSEKRTSVTSDDLVWALGALGSGYDDILEHLNGDKDSWVNKLGEVPSTK